MFFRLLSSVSNDHNLRYAHLQVDVPTRNIVKKYLYMFDQTFTDIITQLYQTIKFRHKKNFYIYI